MRTHAKRVLIVVGIIALLVVPIVIHAIQAHGELCQPAKWLKVWVGIVVCALSLYVCYSDFLFPERLYKLGGTRVIVAVFLVCYAIGWARGKYLIFPNGELLIYFASATIALAMYESVKE